MTTALVIAICAAVVGWGLFFIALCGGNDQYVERTKERDQARAELADLTEYAETLEAFLGPTLPKPTWVPVLEDVTDDFHAVAKVIEMPDVYRDEDWQDGA